MELVVNANGALAQSENCNMCTTKWLLFYTAENVLDEDRRRMETMFTYCQLFHKVSSADVALST